MFVVDSLWLEAPFRNGKLNFLIGIHIKVISYIDLPSVHNCSTHYKSDLCD